MDRIDPIYHFWNSFFEILNRPSRQNFSKIWRALRKIDDTKCSRALSVRRWRYTNHSMQRWRRRWWSVAVSVAPQLSDPCDALGRTPGVTALPYTYLNLKLFEDFLQKTTIFVAAVADAVAGAWGRWLNGTAAGPPPRRRRRRRRRQPQKLKLLNSWFWNFFLYTSYCNAIPPICTFKIFFVSYLISSFYFIAGSVV